MEPIKINYELKADSDEKKRFNIDCFATLDRTNLAYGAIERRLLMKEFPTGEKLYIQYPGKESAREKNPRPWDFRPKMMLSNGEWLKDLSFKDVWDDLYAFRDLNVDMSYIATLFFRIAYMLDCVLTTRELDYEDVNQSGEVINRGKIKLTWFEYNPAQEIIDGAYISNNSLRGAALLPYLAYNDYLAQNEDCKYYYRSVHDRKESWNGNTGRRNTLLTHMSVIAFIENKLKFTEITDMFQRGMGVAPIPTKLIEDVTSGRVTKQ